MLTKKAHKSKIKGVFNGLYCFHGDLQHEKALTYLLMIAHDWQPEEKPSKQGENQQQTQPNNDAGPKIRTQATLMEGERSHHCTIPALLGYGRLCPNE